MRSDSSLANTGYKMIARVSVEIPVFKHRFLEKAIESVMAQTFGDWVLVLLSDGAGWRARRIMKRFRSDRVRVHFQENRGVGPARRRLAELTDSEYMLTLDDDDELEPTALEEMTACMAENPDAAIVRARRRFIGRQGNPIEATPWFPFEPRILDRGMTADVHNHSQPAMLRRSLYEKTEGWAGFDEYKGAGEDCDIFLKMEEVGRIVLLDRVLYRYRLHRRRFSRDLGPESAYAMWRMLADQTIRRRGLALERINDRPPFQYRDLSPGDCPWLSGVGAG